MSVCEESGEVALHAAGGVIDVLDAVLTGVFRMPSAQCVRLATMPVQRQRWDFASSTTSPLLRAMPKDSTAWVGSRSLTGTFTTGMGRRRFFTRTARCFSSPLTSGLGIRVPGILPKRAKAKAWV